MVETSYYFDGLVTGDATLAPYSTDRFHTNWQILLSKTDDEGVISNYLNELIVAGIGGGVTVASGAALVDGSFYENTATVTVIIPTPITDPRIDRIVLQKDWGNQTIRITRLPGTENPAPTAPALTQTAGAIWEIPLAQLLITVAGVITVTDERELAKTPLSPGGGLIEIETIVSTGTLTQFQFSDIPQIFRHLWLYGNCRGGRAAFNDTLSARFNGDAGNNYSWQSLLAFNVTLNPTGFTPFTNAPFATMPAAGATANLAGSSKAFIPNYRGDKYKSIIGEYSGFQRLIVAGFQGGMIAAIWRNIDAITSITVFGSNAPASPFASGSTITLYGVR